MYGKEDLEKVQLLWSIEPVSLSYVRVLKEHFLIVGQTRESSICYWFGGMDAFEASKCYMLVAI
jgi:hypothetical protein